MAKWMEGLQKYGNYYEGIVDEGKIDEVLETHRRDTVSIFGTRSSCRVARARPSRSESTMEVTDENDPCQVTCLYHSSVISILIHTTWQDILGNTRKLLLAKSFRLNNCQNPGVPTMHLS